MIKIGHIIANRKILAMTDKFVLAECTEESPEPFTVWRIDPDGNGVHSGKYFLGKQDAEWEFCSLVFDWFQDNVAINLIDEKEPASEVEAPEQVAEINIDKELKRLLKILLDQSQECTNMSELYNCIST